MPSEPPDEQALAVALPGDLDEWLDEKAAALDAEPAEVVVQLLATYRAADELGDDLDPTALAGGTDAGDVEAAVEDAIDERISDVADAVAERRADDAGAVEERLVLEIDSLRDDVYEKIQDVRERIVQVKRETDAKAPADHDHEEFAELASTLEAVEARVADLEDADGEAVAEELRALSERLDDVEEKLRTVAWVVGDLKEERGDARRPVDRLRRAAAAADVDRAVCENCDRGVHVALLSAPTCPHCDAAVTDVRPASGFFDKPTLVVAEQLDSGEERSNVPDAAERE